MLQREEVLGILDCGPHGHIETGLTYAASATSSASPTDIVAQLQADGIIFPSASTFLDSAPLSATSMQVHIRRDADASIAGVVDLVRMDDVWYVSVARECAS